MLVLSDCLAEHYAGKRKLAVDEDELKRLLKERRRGSSGPLDGMDLKSSVGDSVIKEVVKTRDGKTAYEIEKRVSANPYSAEQREEITHVTPPCESCGEPITSVMFAQGDVKPCLTCGKKTCPRCRANTDLHELKPQVRGQPVCLKCWNSSFVARELFITCPTCKQPVKDGYDVKTCLGWCGRKICPSCGVHAESEGLVCGECFPKYTALRDELGSWRSRYVKTIPFREEYDTQ